MSQKSTETPNQKIDWDKVLNELGLFGYHSAVVQGIQITNDGRILSCEIIKEAEKENG